MRLFNRREPEMVETATALPGRSEEMRVPTLHEVLGTPLKGPFPGGIRTAIFGMGCFWGAERTFWQAQGVYTTAVGYAGGFTPNPTYEEVCSGMTGHAEVVLVGYDVSRTSYEDMLRIFWEGHDPTQGMRQGNDLGTQYRSLLMWQGEDQRVAAEASRDAYQERLTAAGLGTITTEFLPPTPSTPFTTRRPTTSSTSPRTRADTVRTTPRACPARSGWASPRSPSPRAPSRSNRKDRLAEFDERRRPLPARPRGPWRVSGMTLLVDSHAQHLVDLDLVGGEPDPRDGHVQPPHPSTPLADLGHGGGPVTLEVSRPRA